MRKIFIGVIILFVSCNPQGHSLEETKDYLEYIIGSNLPFKSFDAELKFIESNEKESQRSRFSYVIRMLDESGRMTNSKNSLVYIHEMKNIILEESMYDYQKKYSIRIGLLEDENSSSFTSSIVNGKIDVLKISEVTIILPYDEVLASKIKKALIHVGKLNGIKLKDLNSF